MKKIHCFISILTALLMLAGVSCVKMDPELEHENPFDPDNPDYVVSETPPSNPTPGQEWIASSANEIIVIMVWIPPGSFMMGAQDDEQGPASDEYPRHQVTISEGFWMGKYEVTQAQWEVVAETSPFRFDSNPNRPAEMVSWNDIHDDFLDVLNSQETSSSWRLPTEAEWEYASRAGFDDIWFWWGSSYDDLGDYAWYLANSDRLTHDVGGKLPNPWGLYDMHGNVWEWCEDWHGYDYYINSPGTDPQGPAIGEYRVQRGGSWFSYPSYCRSASREPPGTIEVGTRGFRVVFVPSNP